MKRFLIVPFLVTFAFQSNAQDTVQDKIYISVGASVWNHFAINNVLKQNGLRPIGLFTPMIGIGEILRHKNFSANVEMSSFFSGRKTDGIRYTLNGLSFNLNVQYKILKVANQSLYAGLNLDYMTSNLGLYSDNNVVNLQNLSQSVSTGLMQLYNSGFLLGPSLSTGNLFPHSDFSMSVALSYEFNIISGRWKSRYAQVIHSPKEDASRFNISLWFPF